MRPVHALLALLGAFGYRHVQAKAVFAHFMVGNTGTYTATDWRTDMQLAKQAHIDAFALNIARGDPTNAPALALAFSAASAEGFKLFFSFDFAGNGPWAYAAVKQLCTQYAGHSQYFTHNGKPLISTFEGPAQYDVWQRLRNDMAFTFIPDWSSLGAFPAASLGNGVADGLFSWAAWPWGNTDMDTYTDASYKLALQQQGGEPYMMPASPWFFTNVPGYKKNWMWRGDDLWYDRWIEIFYLQPEFVQIISWNDYAESHYIGPLVSKAMEAFDIGRAPYNYATGMPHDGWRLFLPWLIDTYKNGLAPITREGLVGWYRTSPGTACSSGGTTGNTASQLQLEFPPSAVAQDKIFFSALLTSSATVSVTVGGVALTAAWSATPQGGIGMYHGSASFAGRTGAVVIRLIRGGQTIAEVSNGPAISTSCPQGITNWNAWVGSANGPAITATPTRRLDQLVCVNGVGANNFGGLCGFACHYGYCPWTACVCRTLGDQVPTPTGTFPNGYPLAHLDTSYNGLCSFDCSHGYCPPTACSTVSVPLPIATVNNFGPPACRAGTGPGNLAGLCSFSCAYGHCPVNACTCTSQGLLPAQPPFDPEITGVAAAGQDPALYDGLCGYACARGYCPEAACTTRAPPTGSWIVNVVIRTPSGGLDYTEEMEVPFQYDPPSNIGEICATEETARASGMGWTCYSDCRWIAGLDASHAWDKVQADDALEALIVWYSIMIQEDGTPLLPAYADMLRHFPLAVGAYWGGRDPDNNYGLYIPEDYTCELIDIGCKKLVQCGDTPYTALDLVLQSFGNLAAYFTTISNALTAIQGRIQSDCISISGTFAAHSSGPTAQDIFGSIVSVLQLVPALASGRIWGKLLSEGKMDGVKSGADGAAKLGETFSPVAGLWSTWGEEATSELESKIELATNLASAVSNFTQGAKDGLSDNLKWLLQVNPNDQWSGEYLKDVLQNGAFIRNPIAEALISATEVQNSYATAINGLLISWAWKQDDNAFPAIIVMDGTGVPDNPSPSHMNTNKLRNVKMEYRGKTFWLVHAMQVWSSTSDWAWELLGYDALPVQGSSWGFSWHDVVKSSYDAWVNNDNVYPYPTDPLFQGFGEGGGAVSGILPYETGIKTPGLFGIPLCDVVTMEKNIWYLRLRRGKYCEEHPCCPGVPNT